MQKPSTAIWDINIQNAHIARLGRCHFGIKLHQSERSSAHDFNSNHLIVLYARSEEECDAWVNALQMASERKLEDYYEILHLIGEGGFAKVRLGRNLITGEQCAIKTMNKAEAQTKVVGTEIAIIKRVNHPNIVKTFDIFETSEYIHIVMEYMEGGMLYDSIEDGVKFEEADVIQFMRELLDGVLYLHQIGIVHRDIKPENVLCTSRQTPLHVKIADFGLSSISSVADTKTNRLLMSTMIGTPEFVAPEIARQETYTEKVDMWALGMLCYNVIAGKLPLDESLDMISQIQNGVILTFPEPDWQYYSPMAQSFVRSLLCSEADKRLSPLGCLVHPWLSTHIPEKSTKFGAHGRVSTFLFANTPPTPFTLQVYDSFSAKRQWTRIYTCVNALCKLAHIAGVKRLFENRALCGVAMSKIRKGPGTIKSTSTESESIRVGMNEFGEIVFSSSSSLPKMQIPWNISQSITSNSHSTTPLGGTTRNNSESNGFTQQDVKRSLIESDRMFAVNNIVLTKKDERSASVPVANDNRDELEFGDLSLEDETEESEAVPRSLGNFPLSFKGFAYDVGLPRLPTFRKKVRAAFGVETAKGDSDNKGTRKATVLKKDALEDVGEAVKVLPKEQNDTLRPFGNSGLASTVLKSTTDGRSMPDRKPSLKKKILSSLTRDQSRIGSGSKWTFKWMKKESGRFDNMGDMDTTEDFDKALGLDEFSAIHVEESDLYIVNDNKSAGISADGLSISYSDEANVRSWKMLPTNKLYRNGCGKTDPQLKPEWGSKDKGQRPPVPKVKHPVKTGVIVQQDKLWNTDQPFEAMSPVTPAHQ